eukprot:scaffold1869_cov122-Cylindrotheca_fusiformis.AAC.28
MLRMRTTQPEKEGIRIQRPFNKCKSLSFQQLWIGARVVIRTALKAVGLRPRRVTNIVSGTFATHQEEGMMKNKTFSVQIVAPDFLSVRSQKH